MKKTILLLFLTCIIVQHGFAQANNSDEKFDLTPKIKKGDSWKMVFDVGNLDVKGQTLTTGMLSKSSLLNLFKLNKIRVKSEWDVLCVELQEEKIKLKFILTKYKEEGLSVYSKEQVRSFNDTDYPLNMSEEHIKQINQFIGKSFICVIPWRIDDEITIVVDEFIDKSIMLPTTTFMSKNLSMNLSVNTCSNTYSFSGPPMVKIVMDLWRSVFPQNSVSINEVWTTKLKNEDKDLKFNMKLKSHNDEYSIFEVENEDEKMEVVIDNVLGFTGIFNFTSRIRVYSYDAKNDNSLIVGNYNNDTLNGIATFKIKYPIQSGEIKVTVTNGKFSLLFDLKESVFGTLSFQGVDTDLFLTPGMHVNLDWHKKSENPEASGVGADDINCMDKFRNEKIFNRYYLAEYSKSKIIEITNSYKKRVNEILKEYEGLLSPYCKDFVQTETAFRIGLSFVSSINAIEVEKIRKSKNAPFNIVVTNEKEHYLIDYVDSLKLIGTVSNCSHMYHTFITEYLKLKQSMFLYERGRRRNDDKYRENLLFAGIQYIGYPYYYSNYKLLEAEILKGNHLQIEKELVDFAALPCNPSFSNALNNLIQKMELIKVGKPFPFPEIIDTDNKTQELPKGELCIVDFCNSFYMTNPQHKEELEELTRIIKEDERIKKINYVVVRPDFAKGKMVETLSNDTVNFKHIYLPKDDMFLFEKINLIDGRRFFLLDENLKIIHNNIGRIDKYSGHELPKIIDDYFESQNQPTSQAGMHRLLLVILISVVGFGFLSWLIIRTRTKQIAKREEARRKLSELELRAIRSQMNPHFIFNAMGSIQNLINQNNIKNANLYLASFARLMRMVLTNSNKKLVSLSHELELLKHYLELEQLRVDFQFDISVADNVDPETEEIPGMLVQPFVENAVIHGITPKGKGTISVKFSKSDGYLVCEIIDDGVGINTKGIGNGNGIAMKLSEKRLNLLNSQLHEKLRLTVENRMDNEKTEGTKITLLIPIG